MTNYEVVMPDRYHAVGDQFEVIGIGSTTYLKVNNQWQRQKDVRTVIPSSGTLPSMVDPKQQEALFASARLAGFIKDVKLLGSEVFDGTPTLVYEVTSLLGNTYKIWIAVSDDLPRKFESDQNPPKVTIIYYDYNADITINPPIP